MTVVASLIAYHQHMLAGDLYAKWKRSNPKIAAAIETYWQGGARPTNVTSETGLALLSAADAYRAASLPTTEEPMPYPEAPII